MEVDEQFKQLAVKVVCKDYAGSGFLIQPATQQCTYVITARHCLEGTEEEPQTFTREDIIIRRGKVDATAKKLEVEGCYLHKNKEIDLAILTVKYIDDIPSVSISKCKFEDSVYVYGYPNILSGQENPRELLTGTISDSGSLESKIEFKVTQRQETIDSGTSSNIKGFSGAGICSKINENLVLNGIFSELKDPKATHNTYCGFCIEHLEDIIKEYQLPLLFNYKLTTFDYYKDTAFEMFQDCVRIFLKNRLQYINHLKPYTIIYQIGMKLLIPYSDEHKLSDELWHGWIQLLVFLYIIDLRVENVKDIYYSTRQNKSHLKFFYSEKHKRVQDIISNIFKDKEILDDINNNDVIILNSKTTPSDKYYDKNRIGNIVKSIDMESKFNNGIDISKADCTKNICGIHIRYFEDKFFEKINDTLDVFKVGEELKKVILEVFENAVY